MMATVGTEPHPSQFGPITGIGRAQVIACYRTVARHEARRLVTGHDNPLVQ
jgi:hypothetical protein